MAHRERWILIAVLIAAVPLAACGRTASEDSADSPAEVRSVQGSDRPHVILTAEAADRIGIETAPVEVVGSKGTGMAVPYAAVLYDPTGATWVYTNPEPLTFVRESIEVREIRDELALLTAGPPVGTPVVTVGAALLLGTEYEVGEE